MSGLFLITTSLAHRSLRDADRHDLGVAVAPLCADGATCTTVLETTHTVLATVTYPGPHAPRVSVCRDGPHTLALAGYLARDESGGASDAMRALAAWRARGVGGIEALDGSFVIALVEQGAERVTVWTDRCGTRPMFYAAHDDRFVLAPALKCLGAMPGARRTLNPAALAAMTLNGALLGEQTYFTDIALIGPARRLTFGMERVENTRYWRREFQYDPPAPPSPPCVAETLATAVARHARAFARPVLALSGGLDSRLIQAAALARGHALPAVTWGFDRARAAGSDVTTAQESARRAGVHHHVRIIDVDALPRHAERVVWVTDGLTGHLGNYTEGDLVAREISWAHDVVLRGDEMFGWAALVTSRREALRRVGVNVGKRLQLLQFLLRRDVADGMLADYARAQNAQLAQCDPESPPDDVKDQLYHLTRFPRLIVSQSPLFRLHLEVATPLLDRAVLELVHTCPPALRAEKQHVTRCAAEAFPDEFAIPLNRVHSRTSWRARLRRLGPAPRYLVETLLEPLASFDAWFDRMAIHAWLALATAEGARAVPPPGAGWWPRLARRWQAWWLRPTFKERVVLNLATLKLWFKLFA